MNRSKGISINRESIIVFLFLGMLSYIFQGIILMSRINLADAISLSMVFIIIMYLMLFIVSKRQISRVSFFRTLLLLSLFFYFGQHILVLFGSSYLATTTNYTIISCNVSDQNVIRATFFIARMILVLYLGYGIGCKGDAFAISFERDDDTRSEKDRNYTKLVFSIIFWVCVIPAFIVAIYRMGLAASIGYSELRDMDDTVYTSAGTFMVICSYIQNWFLPALYMNLLLSNRRKRIFYLLILAIYSLLYVLSGSRFTLLKIGVVVFLIIYYSRVGKIC